MDKRARTCLSSPRFQMSYGMINDLLQYEKPKYTVGRPVIPFRKVMDGILYVLRTGCQWKMLPKDYGSVSACHRRFQE
jgi:transposase